MLQSIASIFAHRQLVSMGQLADLLRSLFAGGFSFRRFFASLMMILQLLGSVIFDTPVTPAGQKLDLTGYELVFCDEFDGNSLDTDAWFYRGNGARRNGFNAPSQVRVENGKLTITAEYLTDGEYGEGWYAGMIALNRKYCRGYFEIKCICNKDKGFWSAFWLQADHPYEPEISRGGIGGAEIDIFEAMSYGEPFGHNAVIQTVHCAGMAGDTSGELNSQGQGFFYGNDIYNKYNTYGLEWTEDEYIFYINGVESARTSWADGVSQVDEQVIVSLEIPAEISSKFDKDTYKTEFIVDYVKIYQSKLTATN